MKDDKEKYRGYWIELMPEGAMWKADVIPGKSGMVVPENLPARAPDKNDALSMARHKIDALLSIIA